MRRRFLIWALFLSGGLLNCAAIQVTGAWAADYKLAFIDSEKIFAGYNEVKSAQGQFNQDLEGWIRQYEAKKAEIDKLQKDFEAQRLMLSDARRKEREDELQLKLSELGQFERDIWGPTGKVSQRNDQLSRTIIARIKEVVQQIAESDGYTMVFDASDGNLVYGDPTLDLTDRVLAELNATPAGQ